MITQRTGVSGGAGKYGALPRGSSAWARPVLLGIAAVAAFLYAWNMAKGRARALLLGGRQEHVGELEGLLLRRLRPQSHHHDRQAGRLVPAAGAVRPDLRLPSLGLSRCHRSSKASSRSWSCTGSSAEWAGVTPGLLAAALFTLTPIAASMFGHSMEDGALTLCLVLAADAYQRAVMEARLRSLIWFRGVGGARLPGEDDASLDDPARAGHRLPVSPHLRRCGAASGSSAWPALVMLAVSLSWIALYTFTPASDRPLRRRLDRQQRRGDGLRLQRPPSPSASAFPAPSRPAQA